MITRDRNRASIIWSVGNETPVTPHVPTSWKHCWRQPGSMILHDWYLLQSEVNYQSEKKLRHWRSWANMWDVVAFNQHLGWYGSTIMPEYCRTAIMATIYKNHFYQWNRCRSGRCGFHADSLTIFSEEYQEWYYREQVLCAERMPSNLPASPWILADFRSPRRNKPQALWKGWITKATAGS